ncbi:antirestriction protein [Superficieibacter sp. 1612_C1]|uniref:antirestriction protein n=1 Tax=Superficieibacter sp. 1612_C1 TaxID=2780382 RepID=UPI0018843808|nr:antirestriction protein [Superficieibacter sp. 1612_C1]
MNQTVICDAVRLEGAQRLTFLPDLFGGDFMMSEASMYAYAHRYCPDYTGGFWQFYRLPDGGGFMAPDVESLTLCNADIEGFNALLNIAMMHYEQENGGESGGESGELI